MLKKKEIQKGNRVSLVNSNTSARMIAYNTLADIGLVNGQLGTIVQSGADSDGDVLVRWDGFINPVGHPSGDDTILWVNKSALEIV